MNAQANIAPTKLRRICGLLIDIVFFQSLALAFGLAIGLIFGEPGIATLRSVPPILSGLLMFTAFYIAFESLWQKTPGKFFLGMKVVHEEGGRPSFDAILIRSLCRLIPLDWLSFVADSGWHDRLSQTKVIMNSNAL